MLAVLPAHTPPAPIAVPCGPRVNWLFVARMVGLVVLTCACYWPSLRGSFLWDDDFWLTHNALVRAPGGWWKIWFSTEALDYLPLTQVSFRLEWPWWGEDPLPYRIDNLLLHGTNALLLWRLLLRLRVPGAWYGALLFAVHPVNVASVAWIAERKNTLSMAFYLLSLLGWVAADDQPSGRRRLGYFGLSLLAFALALLSKSSVVMLPCVLGLLTWWRRGGVRWSDGWRMVPFFALALAAGLVTIWFQHHRAMGTDPAPVLMSWTARGFLVGRVLLFYLGKTLLPWHLGMIYPRWTPGALPWAALPLLVVAGGFGAAWLGRRRWGRGPVVALGYFALTVLPVSGLIAMAFAKLSFVSDHLVYVPMIGLLAGVSAGLTTFRERSGPGTRGACLAAMVLLAGGLVLAARQRADEFGSSRRLWTAALRVNPDGPAIHNNLALALEDERLLPAAEAEFRRALVLDPVNFDAENNLGWLLQREGRWPEAAASYERALTWQSDAKTRNNYGAVLLQLNALEQAREQFRAAVRLEPGLLGTHFNLYTLAAADHDDPVAAAELRACLRIAPDDVPSLLALAALELRDGTAPTGETVALAKRGCRLLGDAADAVALATLSKAYLRAGRRSEAIAAGERAEVAARASGQAEAAGQLARYVQGLKDAS